MLHEPVRPSLSSGRLSGMWLRIPWTIVLLIGLAGCVLQGIDAAAVCLEEHPGKVGCCHLGDHVSNGTCCGPGAHAISDVEHPDWRVCVFDEDPCTDGGACLDAGTGTDSDAGADAP